MPWEKILWALLLLMMILFLLPRARAMFTESKKTAPGDWSSALLPLGLVLGFVALLVMLVR